MFFRQELTRVKICDTACSIRTCAPFFCSSPRCTHTLTPQSTHLQSSNETQVYSVPGEAREEWLSFTGPVRAAPRDGELTETSSCQTHWLCDGLSVRQSERMPRHTGSTATSMKDTHTHTHTHKAPFFSSSSFFFFSPSCLHQEVLSERNTQRELERERERERKSSSLTYTYIYIFFFFLSGLLAIFTVASHLCSLRSWKWCAAYYCQP